MLYCLGKKLLSKWGIKLQVTSYKEALAFIHGRRKFTKSPDLERMKKFAHYLGDPQKKTKFIHVTGTNGKGSTVAFLAHLLHEQGFSVGTFTSPFITQFNERISIDFHQISDEELVELVNKVIPVVKRLDDEYNGEGPKEFEVVTMLMFLYFAKKRPDYAVVEVGIGGTYDSTNILMPEISVITEVALDHTQILGETLSEIANAKAGIIKEKRPVVVGKLARKSLEIIKEVARKNDAKLYQAKKDFNAVAKSNVKPWEEIFEYQGFGIDETFEINLLGTYQIENASLALSTFLVLAKKEGFRPIIDQIKSALKKTTWPGRFEKISSKPLIVLDGAHNEDAVQKLVKTLKERFATQKIYVIASILADKSSNQMRTLLEELPNVELLNVDFDAPRQVSQPDQKSYENWRDALSEVLAKISSGELLLFTGSLYFISEVRNYWREKDGSKISDL